MSKKILVLTRKMWAACLALFIVWGVLPPLQPVQALQGTAEPSTSTPGTFLIGDLLRHPDTLRSEIHSWTPSSDTEAPGYYETSAFLVGKVAVGVILPESMEGSQNEKEDWLQEELDNVEAEIRSGLGLWQGWWPGHAGGLEFVVDFSGDAVASSISSTDEKLVLSVTRQVDGEPVSLASTEQGWMNEAFASLPGPAYNYPYNQAEVWQNWYAYANDLRTSNDADWAFLIFVADSSEDFLSSNLDPTPGKFSDNKFVYSYLYGPVVTMTYNNANWGIEDMDTVLAHEVAHLFGAADQYATGCLSVTEKYGYLAVANSYCRVINPISGEPSPRLMYDGHGEPDSITKQQVGWRDEDTDGYMDVEDTAPEIIFSPYNTDPTTETNLTYQETLLYPQDIYRAYDVPYAAIACTSVDSCYYIAYASDVDMSPAATINAVNQVQYQVDGGAWESVTATDGTLDSAYEIYQFSTGTLAGGRHIVKAKATNAAGAESFIPFDTFIIAEPATNDFFANRINTAPLSYDHAVDTSTATALDASDPIPTCGNGRGGHSVWYEYTADTTETIFVDTHSSNFDTVLSIWTGSPGATSLSNPVLQYCNDDADPLLAQTSEISFEPTIGTTYYILVSEYDSTSTPVKTLPSGKMPNIGEGDEVGGILVFRIYTKIHTYITRTQSDPSTRSEVGFNVSFSEPVWGLTVSDFIPVVVDGYISKPVVTDVVLNGSAYEVTISTGDGSGRLGLEIGITEYGDSFITTPYDSSENYQIIKAVTGIMGDFTGDGYAEPAVFRPATNTWYIRGLSPVTYAAAGDIPVPADYNGDGKTDIAIFRPSNNTWYIRGGGAFLYAKKGDIPVPGDYNGDGFDDIAIFRPSNSTWYIRGLTPRIYGMEGDIPVPADYNGDGIDDIAIFRPSDGKWYIQGIGNFRYGTNGDRPVPGDYNGDGKAEVAVFRASNNSWYIQGVGIIPYGLAGDLPVPGNYTGTKNLEIAVFRSANSTWYIRFLGPYLFGKIGDIPV